MLLLVIVAIGVVVVVVMGLFFDQSEADRHAGARAGSAEFWESFLEDGPGYNPATGQYEDQDGTPYGAIEDTLMAADEDGF